MALRVLLADESSTIKRVMQLALQDFAVEVKSVHSGVDVLEVAKTFKPEIIFADIILQKRNGYDVCGDLKADPETRNVPVVLMWSSFMELDQAAYQRSGANGKLEKPFDVETIRGLVKDNVAKLREDTLSEFLNFPTNISRPLIEEETQKKQVAQTAPPPQPRVPDAPPPQVMQMPAPQVPSGPPPELPPFPGADDDDNDSAFALSDLTAAKAQQFNPPPPPTENEDEDWVKQDISKFTLDLSPVKIGGEDAAITFDVQHGSIEGEKQLTSTYLSNEPPNTFYDLRSPPPERTKAEDLPFPDFDKYQATETRLPVMDEIEFNPSPEDTAPTAPTSTATRGTAPLELEKQMSADQLEKIIRAQSKEVIAEVVRKVVPEIATQLIREEIKRLMAESP